MNYEKALKLVSHKEQSNGLYTVEVRRGGFGPLSVPNVAFMCRFGSHLHGTTTPTSDLDLKAVFLSPLNEIILGRDKQTREVSTGKDNERNMSGDLDVDFIELRKFLSDAMKGQTYAVEMIHCNDKNVILNTRYFQEIVSNRDKILTNRVLPFIGYCKNQAHKYGLKGERLAATEKVLSKLREFNPKRRLDQTVVDALPLDGKHVRLVEHKIKGRDEPATLLKVNNKKYDFNIRISQIIKSLENLVAKYGKRARNARDGVDWKAVSHAYRCIYELEELLTTGGIVFPLEQAEFLTKVKLGQIDYEDVQNDLPELIERVEQIESDLPEQPDKDFWHDWIIQTYRAIDIPELY